jgi:hypothetical protein
MRFAHLARAAARATQPVARRAPLRCLAAQTTDPSTVTVTDSDGPHALKFLGEQQVRVIKSELMAADTNGDGRLDADELRELLKRHKASFTDKEIEELGELFYASKAGGSVAHDRFVHALDVKLNHLAAGMQPGQINPFYEPAAKLDKMLLKYAHDVLDQTPEKPAAIKMGQGSAY